MLYLFILSCAPKKWSHRGPLPELTKREDIVEDIHGIQISDPYRWLEDGNSQEVKAWVDVQNLRFEEYIENVPQRKHLYDRLEELWRYDDEDVPRACLLDSTRAIVWKKKANEEKWSVFIRERQDQEERDRLLLNPNTWNKNTAISNFYPSPDCRFAVYGTSNGGDEDSVLKVMSIDTLEVYQDTMKGRTQGSVAWKHDNSGFYYSAWPTQDEVPQGEQDYHHRGYYHQLGTGKEEDYIVIQDELVKEHFHGSYLDETGRFLFTIRSSFNATQVWMESIDPSIPYERTLLTPNMDAQYLIDLIDEQLYITTNLEADNYRVMTASLEKPTQEHWKEFIPEQDTVLNRFSPIAGTFYASYYSQGAPLIKRYNNSGEHLGSISNLGIGTAHIYGHWTLPDVVISFSSFMHPQKYLHYNKKDDRLHL
ncbi:MAG: hypothetical protein CMK59_08070, partial [Proteobacteria bacterium]|nr:hypothetical protein [Pseudomonadota bacterium]